MALVHSLCVSFESRVPQKTASQCQLSTRSSCHCMLPFHPELLCAPSITPLSSTAHSGEERFAKRPNEGRVAELESLQEFLKDAVADFDAQQATIVAPLDRMKLLLTSKDKRTTLLEMAGVHRTPQYRWRQFQSRPAWCLLHCSAPES